MYITDLSTDPSHTVGRGKERRGEGKKKLVCMGHIPQYFRDKVIKLDSEMTEILELNRNFKIIF